MTFRADFSDVRLNSVDNFVVLLLYEENPSNFQWVHLYSGTRPYHLLHYNRLMMSLTLAKLYEEPESRLRQRPVNPANELLRQLLF